MKIIAIAGGTASGKTTLANEIKSLAPDKIAVVSLDSYYKTLPEMEPVCIKDPTAAEQLAKQGDSCYANLADANTLMNIFNLDHPESWDFQKTKVLLANLKKGYIQNVPHYEYELFQPSATNFQKIDPSETAILVIEGLYALYDNDVVEMCDFSIYVDVDSELRLLRAIKRDTVERGRSASSVIKVFVETIKPQHDQFVSVTKVKADILLPTYPNDKLDMLMRSLVSSFLKESTSELERVSVTSPAREVAAIIDDFEL